MEVKVELKTLTQLVAQNEALKCEVAQANQRADAKRGVAEIGMNLADVNRIMDRLADHGIDADDLDARNALVEVLREVYAQ